MQSAGEEIATLKQQSADRGEQARMTHAAISAGSDPSLYGTDALQAALGLAYGGVNVAITKELIKRKMAGVSMSVKARA
jgi:hypothetical protein